MTTALVCALVAALVILPAPPVRSDTPPPAWVFPVVGQDGVDFGYRNTFGAGRSGGRSHHGVDIGTYGKKGVEVVAAADGVVQSVNWSSNPQHLNPERCCTIAIIHDGGWVTWYIHLNNDTPGTDDGLGWGIADGILPGTTVKAGQLIGWVGDSGNAENTSPHLHWEVHAPGGVVVDPTPHADAAMRIAQSGSVHYDPPCPDGRTCDTIAAVDVGSRYGLWDKLDDPHNVSWYYFGNPGDIPFMGDWDGDGVATPGLYRQSDGFVYLRDTNTQGIADREFYFGDPGDVPLVGDFDGDGRDSVSIWRASEATVYIINELGENGKGLGAAEYSFSFGNKGDQPFVGDFDGDGIDTIGLYRQSTGFVYFRNSLTTGIADHSFYYGLPGDRIFVGDWNGDGTDTVAVYRPSTRRVYMNLKNEPRVADWSAYVGDVRHIVTASR